MTINNLEARKSGEGNESEDALPEKTREYLLTENLMLRDEFEDAERKREKADFLFEIIAEHKFKIRPVLETYIELASKVPEGPKEDDALRAELMKAVELLNDFSNKLVDGGSPFSVADIKRSLGVAPDVRYSEAEQIKRYGGEKGVLPIDKHMDTWEATMLDMNLFASSLQDAERILKYLKFTPNDKEAPLSRQMLRSEK